ncbi:hypothetical protein ASD80_08210 [Devosia sp. Root635]|nr:hypothetical protein ASD80_08210 [Devosia sp. Root635]
MAGLTLASVERALRDLWHTVLWEGRTLTRQDGTLLLSPRDRKLPEQWLKWHLREYSLVTWETTMHTAAMMVAGKKSIPVTPVLDRTVLAIRRLNGKKREFVIGRTNGKHSAQARHVNERDMLERVYTGLFLDDVLPKIEGASLTCRDLCRAWWIISDLAGVMMEEVRGRKLDDPKVLDATAFTVTVQELELVLSTALSTTPDHARKLIELFTCDPENTTTLFKESVWFRPLLPAQRDRLHIVIAPLLVGSPIRRIEWWLEMGGISDQGKINGRGKPFERHVRTTLASALSGNPLIKQHLIHPHGLKRVGTSEEIDLLIRIGRTIIVGEVKCFLAPVEPNDHYNYLNALDEAAGQAHKKLTWTKSNLPAVLKTLGVSDTSASDWNILPVVVLNQGTGFGLDIDGIAVTDLHFLELLLGNSEYQGATRFEFGRMVGSPVRLYGSQQELERNMGAILKDPPPLRRYEGQIGWNKEPFPSSDDRPFVIEMPRLVGTPIDQTELNALMESLPQASHLGVQQCA